GDVAKIIDGFVEQPVLTRFNNRPAVMINVLFTTHPDVVGVANRVKKYIKAKSVNLPAGVELVGWLDLSKSFKSRVNILTNSGLGGLVLVFVLLMLFLRPKIAFWVCTGMLTAFMGTLWVLPMVDVSLNMISLFAFILVLGMVVDDAIVIGESIYSLREQGEHGTEAVIKGTTRVARPVFYAGLTTMVAFSPILFLNGTAAAVMKPLPYVVILTLGFSLIESYFILPAHLRHLKHKGESRMWFNRIIKRLQEKVSSGLNGFIRRFYIPFLDLTLRFKALTVASFVGFWMIVFAFIQGGWVRQDFFPNVPNDYIIADATLTDGVAFERALEVMHQMEDAALGLNAYFKDTVGEEPIVNVFAHAEGNLASLTIDLLPTEERKTEVTTITSKWRDAIGDIADLKDFEISYQSWMRDKPLSFVLASNNPKTLEMASKALEVELAKFAGVSDITDTFRSSRQELEISLKPQAETLGLSTNDLARQVRQAFFGEEVQRIPRGRDDVKVKVRYPYETRKSLQALRDMRIRTSDGTEVPFETVASVKFSKGATAIRRLNRKRVVDVTGNVDRKKTDPGEIVRDIQNRVIPELQNEFPDLEFLLEGDQKEISKFKAGLMRNLVMTIFAIYGLIAIAFRSYTQPLLVMAAIPFGYIGGILGHMVFGLPYSMFSMFGVIATAGVVVNDNLVLIDRINELKQQGLSALDAVRAAAVSRFRPILLTTLTTFFGLMPITFQKAPQAQFLIPMAVSLAFGVVLASIVTLALVPALYIWLDSFHTWRKNLFKRAIPDKGQTNG
ncbi:MAG TPA: efflux RND transporter permease subunit, partial [Hellea balneolensis]|nr:efflux RND transporter permease subunit [Hellea balneolensis]